MHIYVPTCLGVHETMLCNPGNHWHSGISACEVITFTDAQESRRKVNLLKSKPTIEMVHMCRVWLCLDRNTTFDLWPQLLHKPSLPLFSPSARLAFCILLASVLEEKRSLPRHQCHAHQLQLAHYWWRNTSELKFKAGIKGYHSASHK